MTSQNNYPDFYQPVEARPNPEAKQLQEASEVFSGLFDDLMLQNMDGVRRFESIKGKPEASLLKHIEDDGEKYTLSLSDRSTQSTNDTSGVSFRDSEKITRDLSLQRIEGGYGREYWSYRMGADGIVRRWDGGDFTAKRQKERELGIEPKMLRGDEPIEEMGRIVLNNLNDLTQNGIPNGQLEEDMGLNLQPVTPDELKGLQAFLSKANPVT
jgi:hypothetical protein